MIPKNPRQEHVRVAFKDHLGEIANRFLVLYIKIAIINATKVFIHEFNDCFKLIFLSHFIEIPYLSFYLGYVHLSRFGIHQQTNTLFVKYIENLLYVGDGLHRLNIAPFVSSDHLWMYVIQF